MRMGKVLAGSGVRYCLFFRDVEVLGVADDSRHVKPGFLFVAVRGVEADGHGFLSDALRRGAAAVVVEDAASIGRNWPKHIPVAVVSGSRRAVSRIASRFHGEPARRVRVVGVTGTNGKTTVSYFIRSILETAGYPCGLMGTIAHDLRFRKAEARNTTPGALETHGLLREMERRGVTFAVMEVSSHALDQGRVEDVPFAGAVFTNLTADHLDYHKTRKRYLQAKRRLFEGLDGSAFAVLNADDWATAVFSMGCRARKVTYGRGPGADLRYCTISRGLSGSAVFLTWRGRPIGEVRIRMPGMHNAANAVAAAAFGFAAQLDEACIVRGLERMTGVPGRLEEVPLGAPFKVFVDYAHTENALSTVLEGLRSSHDGRILLVFGCGGDRDRSKRSRMGRVASEFADLCWLTSDNPRNEDPDAIITEIENGFPIHAWYAVQPDRERAIVEAMANAGPGDAVLVAGKGHENGQKVGALVRPFRDRDVVQRTWETMCSEEEGGFRPVSSRAPIHVA